MMKEMLPLIQLPRDETNRGNETCSTIGNEASEAKIDRRFAVAAKRRFVTGLMRAVKR